MTPCNIKHVDQVKNQLEDAKQWAGVRDVDLVVRGKDNNIRLEARSRDRGNAKAKGLLQELIASINTQFSISGDLVEKMSKITNGYTTNVNFTQKALDELEQIAQRNVGEDVKKDSEITPKKIERVFSNNRGSTLSSKADIEGFKGFAQGKQFQKLTANEKAKTIEQVTKEHRSIVALKDLSAKLAHRIGGKVEFENRTDVDWKGYNQGMTSVLNEAYMTPDTPFHEIAFHPIIRALKSMSSQKESVTLQQMIDNQEIEKICN